MVETVNDSPRRCSNEVCYVELTVHNRSEVLNLCSECLHRMEF